MIIHKKLHTTKLYIRVRVIAGAKKELFVKNTEDSFSISVKDPAEQNRANRRVLEIIAGYFDIEPKQIRIISGHHSSGKIMSIPDDALHSMLLSKKV